MPHWYMLQCVQAIKRFFSSIVAGHYDRNIKLTHSKIIFFNYYRCDNFHSTK